MASLTGIEEVFSYFRTKYRDFKPSYLVNSRDATAPSWDSLECTRLVNGSLYAARAGNLSESSRLLQQSARLGLTQPLGSLPWIKFVSEFSAATGYLFYRLGEPSKAVRSLEEANLADLLLMRVFGQLSRHLHRVRLAQHRAKVEWKLGDRRLGNTLVRELIGHLTGNGDVVSQPLQGSWDNRLCILCPSKVIGEMIDVFKAELREWENS
jgi:hypothetical protein